MKNNTNTSIKQRYQEQGFFQLKGLCMCVRGGGGCIILIFSMWWCDEYKRIHKITIHNDINFYQGILRTCNSSTFYNIGAQKIYTVDTIGNSPKINKTEHIISNAMVLLEYMCILYFGVVIMKFQMHVVRELSKFAGGCIFLNTHTKHSNSWCLNYQAHILQYVDYNNNNITCSNYSLWYIHTKQFTSSLTHKKVVQWFTIIISKYTVHDTLLFQQLN